jgi:hypothetical protein
MTMIIFAVDPGYTESAFALVRMPDLKIINKGKVPNEELLGICRKVTPDTVDLAVIEMVASYGMPVGREVFETCVWIGRFMAATPKGLKFVYRLDEKICLCHDTRANDASIRRALIDRYARHDLKTGRGTKKNPDTFYGVSSDIWSAVAVAVTAYEKAERIEK